MCEERLISRMPGLVKSRVSSSYDVRCRRAMSSARILRYCAPMPPDANHDRPSGTQPAPTLTLSCLVARNQISPDAVVSEFVARAKIESTEIPALGTHEATSSYPLAVKSRLVETRRRRARNPAWALRVAPVNRRADPQSGWRLRGTLAAPAPAPKKTGCAFAPIGVPISTTVTMIL